MALSLPPDFKFHGDDNRNRLLREVVLPVARDHDLGRTLMVGVRRRVNPRLREAGDGLGKADVSSVERLCAEYPEVRFLVTFLSRENQPELCGGKEVSQYNAVWLLVVSKQPLDRV